MKCRHCSAKLEYVFLDLGYAPPSNAYLSAAQLQVPEVTFPLKVYVCNHCWLVQTIDYAEADLLFSSDYAYFSSTSKSWLLHAANYVDQITDRLQLNEQSFVIEVASNDGYLLKNFVSKRIPCLGIEPTDSTAAAAEQLGVPVWREFFGTNIAKTLIAKGMKADLICGNNVYAHLPDINDFTLGLRMTLKPNGTINLEFPHLLQLIDKKQFDTVYHEHFSYLSLTSVSKVFAQAGLRIYDVEELPTHGGSLRIYGCHAQDPRPITSSVIEMISKENDFGLLDLKTYTNFQAAANTVKNDFLAFLIKEKRAGKTIAAYGAAAKGNTLLNYAGIKHDLIDFICDAAASKQNKFMPGSHIPILSPAELSVRKPDWVIVLPWNLSEEVLQQERQVLSWGGKFIVAIPELRIIR